MSTRSLSRKVNTTRMLNNPQRAHASANPPKEAPSPPKQTVIHQKSILPRANIPLVNIPRTWGAAKLESSSSKSNLPRQPKSANTSSNTAERWLQETFEAAPYTAIGAVECLREHIAGPSPSPPPPSDAYATSGSVQEINRYTH